MNDKADEIVPIVEVVVELAAADARGAFASSSVTATRVAAEAGVDGVTHQW
ncbi:hypothetical protein ACIQAC_40640 [Streptomyces sp. NPDC088387]|uniref:hypothetical protein n=1 Tax=Streptomyces sp. NPDC088387 TaxID=3365859 RepID=UPI003829D1A9